MRILRIVLLSVAVLAVSCVRGGEKEPEVVTGEVEFVSQHGRWTYISLESGEVVGTSVLGDEGADAAWAHRDDWDIAVCDSLIRTNGGASGMGQGALSAESVSAAVSDTEQEIW